MKNYTPSIDGIPGIIPGTITVPPPPNFEEKEIETVQPQYRKSHHPWDLNNIPKHKRRMMPCNKMEKKDK